MVLDTSAFLFYTIKGLMAQHLKNPSSGFIRTTRAFLAADHSWLLSLGGLASWSLVSLIDNFETVSKGWTNSGIWESNESDTWCVKDMCNYVCVKLLWLSSFLSAAVIKRPTRAVRGNSREWFISSYALRSQCLPERVTGKLKQESKGRAAIVLCSVTSDKGTHRSWRSEAGTTEDAACCCLTLSLACIQTQAWLPF